MLTVLDGGASRRPRRPRRPCFIIDLIRLHVEDFSWCVNRTVIDATYCSIEIVAAAAAAAAASSSSEGRRGDVAGEWLLSSYAVIFLKIFRMEGEVGRSGGGRGGEEEEVVNLKFLLGKYFNLIELVCC